MNWKVIDYMIAMAAGVFVFAAVALITADAYTKSWVRDCDKIGATVVDGIAYKCERLPNKQPATPPSEG